MFLFFFVFFLCFFCFFKQKTAYEIKECDWSSDVCSSDLIVTLPTLITMKEADDCREDRIDAEYLRMILDDHENPDVPRDEQDYAWSLATWEGNCRDQMRRWAELPLKLTIKALEDMEKTIRNLQAGLPAKKKRKGESMIVIASPQRFAPSFFNGKVNS